MTVPPVAHVLVDRILDGCAPARAVRKTMQCRRCRRGLTTYGVGRKRGPSIPACGQSHIALPFMRASLVSQLLAGEYELVSIRVFEYRHRPPYLFLRLGSEFYAP